MCWEMLKFPKFIDFSSSSFLQDRIQTGTAHDYKLIV